MKKLLTILMTVMIGLCSLSLSAQETLTVANGTDVNAYIPVYGFYADAYLHSQTIYPGSLVADMDGSNITAMKFYMSTIPGESWNCNFMVKLGISGSAAFSSENFQQVSFTTVYTGPMDPNDNGLVTVTFTTPFEYSGGNLIMDVSSVDVGNYSSGTFFGVSTPGASISGYSYGDASSITPYFRDFIPKTTFTYEGGSDCLSPTNLTTSNIAINSAVFSWSPRVEGTSYYTVVPVDVVLEDTVWTSTTDTSVTLTDLVGGTQYIAYVRTDCGEETSSAPSTTFYTACDIVNTFPYFEGFEDSWIPSTQFGQANNAPLCWSVFNGGGDYGSTGYSSGTYDYRWKSNMFDSHVYEGNHSAVCYTDYAVYPHNDWLITPMMNLPENMQLSFWAQRSSSSTTEPEEISIWISDVDITLTAPEIPAADTLGLDTLPLPGFTQIFQTDIPEGPFNLYEVSLSEYTGNRYIAFVRRYAPNDGYYLCLDNVSVEAIPSCQRPSDLATDSVGSNSAFLSWTSDAEEYIVYYKYAEADSFAMVPNVTLNSDSQYVLEGLTPGHAYQWYVAAVCDEETVLPATSVLDFQTQCMPLTQLPYYADFEENNIGADGDLPACWSKPGFSEYPYIYNYSGYCHSGSHCLNNYSTYPTIAILPELSEEVSIGSLQLSFWAFCYYGTDCTIEVGAMTDPDDATTFIAIDSLSLNNGEYQEFTMDLTSYEGEAHHVALRFTNGAYDSGWGTYPDNLYLDDLTLQVHASCPRPEDVTVSNATSTTATLTWTSEENSFIVYYKAAGDAGYVAANEDPVNENTYTVEGLTPGTNYSFYVSSVCDDETESMSLIISRTTPCEGLTTLPYFCGFEENLVGEEYPLPQCWTRSSANNMYPYAYNYSSFQGSYCLYSYYANTIALPPVNTEELPFSDMMVSFYAKGYSGSILKVGVMSDPSNMSTFVQIGNDIVLNTSYTMYDVSLAGYEGNGNMVAFLTPQNVDIYIDNVTLDHLPDCQRPTVTNVTYTNTEAIVTWAAANEEDDAWQIVITNTYALPSTLEPIDVDETSYTFEELEPSTFYQVYVRTDCGGQYSDWSNVYSFTTLQAMPAAVPYAFDFEEEEESGKWSLVNGSMTNKWFIGTADNNTEDGQYSLYVSADSGATATYNTNGSNTVWAYRDFLFSDATEFNLSFDWKCLGEGSMYDYPTDYLQVLIGPMANVSASSYASTPTSLVELGSFVGDSTWNRASITLDGPVYANTVQRIYFRWYNSYDGGSGQSAVVDNIVISEVECARPVAIEMTSIGTTTATLTITPAAETDGTWEISLNDSTFISYTAVVELENLTPASAYEIAVRTICESGDTSVWSLPISFISECILITSVPQTWDFESDLIAGSPDFPLPVCWNRINSPESTYSEFPYVSSYSGHNAYHALYFTADYSNTYGIMPAIDPEALNLQELELSFYAKQSGNGTNIHFEIGVMTNPSDATTFTVVESIGLTDAYPADPYIVSFAEYTGEGTYIAIRNTTSGYSYASLYIDDITLEEIPSCLPPTSVGVSDITENSASVSWTENGEATSWVIRYYEPGDEENAVTVPATTNPFTLTGLEPATFYIAQVQSNCSETESSTWGTSPSFMTNCVAVTTLPYTESFEGSDLGCWTNEFVVGDNPWSLNYTYASDGSQSVVMNYTVNTQSRLISPVFNLENISDPTISFDYRHLIYTYGNTVDTFAVYYRTDAASDWVRIEGYQTANTDFESDTLVLPNPTATYQIAFWGYGVDGMSIYIDNIKVDGEAVIIVTDPTVTTENPSGVEQTVATMNASITNPDGVEITGKGFAWKLASAAEFTNQPVTGDNFSYTLNNLTPNTAYEYKAYITYNGENIFGDVVSFTTLEQGVDPCDVPTGLAYSDLTHNSFTVTWNANPDATGYTLRHRPANGQWTSVSVATNSHSLTGLTEETTYEVQVMADCGDGNNSDWSATLEVVTPPNGIPTHLLNSIALYPNPAKDYVDVRVDGDVNVTNMEVFDVYGKLIWTNNHSSIQTRINVSGLANGMYFVRVTTENGAVTKTFVKQ